MSPFWFMELAETPFELLLGKASPEDLQDIRANYQRDFMTWISHPVVMTLLFTTTGIYKTIFK